MADSFKESIINKFKKIYGENIFIVLSKLVTGGLFLLILFIIILIAYYIFGLNNNKDKYNSIEIVIILLSTLICVFYTFLIEAVVEIRLKNRLRDRILTKKIYISAQTAKKYGDKQTDMLSTKPAVYGYIFLAKLIRRMLKKLKFDNPKILDWGCGYGQMTYILDDMGFDIQGVDIDLGVENPPYGYRKVMNEMPIFFDLLKKGKIKLKKDLVKLDQYKDNQFDVILASGTWDEVNPEIRKQALNEIKRISRKDGLLINIILNENYSFDKLFKIIKGEYLVKQYKFSPNRFSEMLAANNLKPLYNHSLCSLPRNLTPSPKLRKLYNIGGSWIVKFDYYFLSKLPIIKKYCSKYMIVARNLKRFSPFYLKG